MEEVTKEIHKLEGGFTCRIHYLSSEFEEHSSLPVGAHIQFVACVARESDGITHAAISARCKVRPGVEGIQQEEWTAHYGKKVRPDSTDSYSHQTKCPFLDGAECWCDGSSSYPVHATQRQLFEHLFEAWQSEFQAWYAGSPPDIVYTNRFRPFSVLKPWDNMSGLLPAYVVNKTLSEDLDVALLSIVELNDEASIMVELNRGEVRDKLLTAKGPWRKEIKARFGPGRDAQERALIIG